MKHEIEVYAPRFEVYARDVLAPAVWGPGESLNVHAWCTPGPVGVADVLAAAGRGEFAPVEPGWAWGPAWGTCWFRARGNVPQRMRGQVVRARFSSGTEATVWTGMNDASTATPVRGLDMFRDDVIVAEGALGGESIELWIEAACNHPFGIATFEWDPDEWHRRWKTPTPGRFERAELSVRDDTVWRLHRAYLFAAALLKELIAAGQVGGQRAAELSRTLTEATEAIDDLDVAATADASLAVVLEGLRGSRSGGGGPGGSTPIGLAVGHAHIDTAWLWPIRESRRKVIRSWSNAAELAERDAEFHFVTSQAQQYAWLEQDAPGLFARVRALVEAGRFQPVGAMWVEPDSSMPSGESLIRQVMHGVGYWRERFNGAEGPQRVMFLPDTFGFPASLPGIMRACGLDTFITNKMCWSQQNKIGLTNFRWRGIDGTEVLAHMTPGGDYNATNSPKELRKAEAGLVGRERTREAPGGSGPMEFLQLFGYGDGGGGPTEWMLEHTRLAERCEGVPRMRLGSVHGFVERLHARSVGERMPVWQGELYLESHRGVWTTQQWIKRANRRAEERLALAELCCVAAGPVACTAESRALDRAWKLLLLQQFHDILPGSSIGWVYDDARRDFAEIERLAGGVIERQLPRLASRAGGKAVVLNQTSAQAGGVIEAAGGLRLVRDVPARGVRALPAQAADDPVPVEPVRVGREDDRIALSNGFIRAAIGPMGRVVSLTRFGDTRDLAERGPLNQLYLYEDRPQQYDAWDIDLPALGAPVWKNDGPAERVEIIEQHPLRARVRATRTLGVASRLEQVYELEAESPVLTVRTRVEWRERRRWLRAEFPTPIAAERWTGQIQFGVVERPTHENWAPDRMMFECCAHRWTDLSEPGCGLAILNDGHYGHACRDGVLALSLLRSPVWPDPQADQGTHEFAYGLMPHGGDWRTAGVDERAALFNTPLRVIAAGSAREDATADGFGVLSVETTGAGSVEISCVKPGQSDASEIVVRLAEVRGGRCSARVHWGVPVRAVRRTDALERPIEGACVHELRDGEYLTEIEVGRFGIVTLIGTRA